jgi:heme/copper-type cytochrome/quinol oxidase subunit 4
MTNVLESKEQSKKETGASLMFIGLAIWVAGALVAFFLPASTNTGSHVMSLTIILALGLMGLLLLIVGFLMRGKPEE